MTEQERLAAALEYQGATAAPPTIAQQLAKVPSRLVGALKALGTGSSYGSAEPVNAVNDLARTKFWRGSVFGVPEDVQQRNQARAMEAVSMAAPIVYHGSPHRFAPTAKNPLGEFDPTKIGTGEGAQAYGMGHYLAEAPSVAETYKSAVDPAARSAFMHLQKNNGNVKQTIQEVTKDLKNYEKNQQFLMPNVLNQTKQKLDYLKMQKTGKPIDIGSLYKVDLPDEVVPRMLDYDKPINEQSPYVKEALRRAGINEMSSALAGPMAQGQEAHLAKFGIPGIKYLDEASRKKGTGTRNFVVFPGNEGLLNILGRE